MLRRLFVFLSLSVAAAMAVPGGVLSETASTGTGDLVDFSITKRKMAKVVQECNEMHSNYSISIMSIRVKEGESGAWEQDSCL